MPREKETRIINKKHFARAERERNQMRILVIVLISFGVLLLGVIGYGLLDQYVLSNLRPVAKVDGASITVKDYQKQAQMTRFEEINRYTQDKQIYDFYTQLGITPDEQLSSEMYTLQIELSDTRLFGQKVLNNMIEYRVLQAKAEELGVVVSESDIDEVLHSSFGFFPKGTPTAQNTPTSYFTPTYSLTQKALLATPTTTSESTATTLEATVEPSPEPIVETPTLAITSTIAPATLEPTSAFTATPENTPTPYPTATEYTLAGFQDQFSQYLQQITSYGIVESDVRDYIHYKILKGKVFEALTKDLATQGEQVWVRQILVDTEDAANKALDRVAAGENWIALTKELSIDSYTKNSGGDLGWFPTGLQSSQMDAVAFSLKQYETAIFSDESGWHLIQLLGKEQNRPFSTSVNAQIQSKTYTTWFENAKSSLNVQTFDRWISAVPIEPTLPPPAQ